MGIQRSILIVDDEFGLAEMLRDMLRDEGFDVCLAINGRLALDLLAERRIDLVVTDIMMPVMDGVELAIAIRHSDTHCDIPVVIMTSLPSLPRHQSNLFDAVLRKPFTPDLFMSTINACFSMNGRPAGQR